MSSFLLCSNFNNDLIIKVLNAYYFQQRDLYNQRITVMHQTCSTSTIDKSNGVLKQVFIAVFS